VTKRVLPLPAAIVFLLIGCAPHRQIAKERNLTADEVIGRVRSRNNLVKSLSGSGAITVETQEASGSGSFEVYLKKPDSLRIEFHGPFGIHVGTLTLSKNQFLFYNRRENTAVTGKPDGTTLQSLFRLKMRFDEVLNAFAGEFPLSQEEDSLAQFSVDQGLYVFVYRDQNGTKEFRVDGDDFLVTSYRMIDREGTATLIAFTSRTTESGEITMPSLLRVVFPKERRSITIAYDNIRLNEPVDCSFDLPRQVELLNQ